MSNLPVLDNAEKWSLSSASGLFETDAVHTLRTKKTQRPIALYGATDKHPAQTQLIVEDVIAGFWHTVRHSEAMPKPEKDKIMGRVEKQIIAVKEAREKANDADAGAKP